MVPTVLDSAASATGLPPLTPVTAVTSWVLDPLMLVVIAALGAGYAACLRRARRAGVPRSRGRTVFFYAGLALIALLTMSFLGAYRDEMFWVRAVQNVLLLMTAPMLLALGAPVSLLRDTLPEHVAGELAALARSRTARALTFPGVVAVVTVGTPFAIYLTPLYGATLRSGVVDELVHLHLLGVGFLYYWTRLQIDPTPRADAHLVSLWISIMEVVFDGALGLVLWLGPLRAPEHYLALGRAWGPNPWTDQIIGAGIVWIGGDIAGLPFTLSLLRQWKRDDDRQAVEVDRALDAGEHSEQPTGGSGLWWENDPQLAERFRRR